MNTRLNAWTEERLARLRELYDAGLSHTAMAAELNAAPFQHLPTVSRNACIGKAHRLHWPPRGESSKTKSERSRPASGPSRRVQSLKKVFSAPPVDQKQAAAAERAEQFDPAEVSEFDAALPTDSRVTLLDLVEGMCRWPIGDPQRPDFAFCGGHALAGLPYCAQHSRVAYESAAVRRDMSAQERDRRSAGAARAWARRRSPA